MYNLIKTILNNLIYYKVHKPIQRNKKWEPNDIPPVKISKIGYKLLYNSSYPDLRSLKDLLCDKAIAIKIQFK